MIFSIICVIGALVSSCMLILFLDLLVILNDLYTNIVDQSTFPVRAPASITR